MDPYHHFPIQSQGEASPEAQVKYLMACLKVEQDKNASLALRVRAMELERELDMDQVKRGLNELDQLRLWYFEKQGLLLTKPKKRSWRWTWWKVR